MEMKDEITVSKTDNSKKDTDKKQENKKKSKKIAFIIILIIVVLLLCLRIGNELFNWEPQTIDNVKDGTFPTDKNDLEKFLREKQDASRFTTNIIPYGIYERSTNTLKLQVANPECNSIDCVVRVLVNGEYYYTSSIIKPNQYIDEMVLDKELPTENAEMYVQYCEILQDNSYRTLTTVKVNYDTVD